MKAKRTLEQIQKTQVVKKKSNFLFVFLRENGFSRKSNEDEFSQKSNGGWIFLGIKWGLQNNNNNNNMIRLVPTRIDSGRGKQGFFRDSLIWTTTSDKGFLMPRVTEVGGPFEFQIQQRLKKKKKETNHENNFPR